MSERATASEDAEVSDGDPIAQPAVQCHGVAVGRSGDQLTVHPDRGAYLELVSTLRLDGYWLCTDLCGVDYLGYEAQRNLPADVAPERFEVVANLLDPTDRRRLRVRVQLSEADPRIDSLTSVHPGVDYHEREIWDLFGIRFDGHPHLTRILMPDEWEGHPLRKDYAVGRIPVQFNAPRPAR